MLMPVYATFHNTMFDIRCSKCKRTQENQFFVQNGRVYKTCNSCRDRARVVRMDPETLARLSFSSSVMGPTRHIPDSDSESEPSINPHASLVALGFSYADYNVNAALLASSAAAAAVSSSSSSAYVEEPDPEPEPEGCLNSL